MATTGIDCWYFGATVRRRTYDMDLCRIKQHWIQYRIKFMNKKNPQEEMKKLMTLILSVKTRKNANCNLQYYSSCR